MYPVGSLLSSGGLDPARVAATVGIDDLDAVPVRIAPAWMRAFWIGPVDAMTLPWAMYVAPGALSMDPRRRARLMVHELVHVRQWNDHGVAGFLGRYLADYLRARAGGADHGGAYRGISFETEARDLAGRLVPV